MITMAASANTLIQLTVPDHLRGRVMGVYTTVFAGSTPIGGLATGVLASAYSIALACVVGGVLSIAVATGGILYAFRHPKDVRSPVARTARRGLTGGRARRPLARATNAGAPMVRPRSGGPTRRWRR